MSNQTVPSLPKIQELGLDLLEVSSFQRFITLFLPFLFAGLYFLFAFNDFWLPAVFSLMALSFVTYGSTSHDLVHKNLRLKRESNEAFLFLIELISIRSGHAYKLVHLHHHKRYPAEDDIEGAASRMTFFGSLIEGLSFNFKMYAWALKHVKNKRDRTWIYLEGILCTGIIVMSMASYNLTPVFAVYVALMIMGSWIIPLITSYIPHTPYGTDPLSQTRLFRGKVLSLIAFQHLYHLEHHLYPAVPHVKWPQLAKRLDAYFDKMNIKPVKLWR